MRKVNRYKRQLPAKQSQRLRFTPYAWAKLVFLRDLGPTEVGGFGISSETDLLLIQDVLLVPQVCTRVATAFDDSAVADFFDEQVDRGIHPERFGRIWIHTHPGDSPEPSSTDERTMEKSFAKADWAIMFILARGGRSHAGLCFNAGPGGKLTLPVEVDYTSGFDASEHEDWTQEYHRCVREAPYLLEELRLRNGDCRQYADLSLELGGPWWQD